jgi:hypothetical protein
MTESGFHPRYSLERARAMDEISRQSVRPQSGDRNGPDSPAFEQHFTVKELAAFWKLSEDTVRRCFRKEAGVIEIVVRGKASKRPYVTLRIPESVAKRVHERLAIVRAMTK